MTRAHDAKPKAEMTDAGRRVRRETGPLWVFAYGSLMWRPGFPHTDDRPARLKGWSRSMCVQSILYRGAPEAPGLVMGLTRGGVCHGRAYRVAAADRLAAVEYLDRRELNTGAYRPIFAHARLAPTSMAGGAEVEVYVYVADPNARQYGGRLSEDDRAQRLLTGVGSEGPSWRYLENSLARLRSMGVRDDALERLWARIRPCVMTSCEQTPLAPRHHRGQSGARPSAPRQK